MRRSLLAALLALFVIPAAAQTFPGQVPPFSIFCNPTGTPAALQPCPATATQSPLQVTGTAPPTLSLDLSQPFHFTNGTASTSPTTGAVIIDQGLGVGDRINVGGSSTQPSVISNGWQQVLVLTSPQADTYFSMANAPFGTFGYIGSGGALVTGSYGTDLAFRSNGQLAFGTGGPNLALTLDTSQSAHFVGQLFVPAMTQTAAAQLGTVCFGTSGAITYDATLGCLTSTARVKHDIAPLGGSLDRIAALQPKTFVRNDDVSNRQQIGLIAEDVEAVESRLVAYDTEGKPRGWSQPGMIAELVGAVRELKSRLEKLEVCR
jgi:hypothetical protein